MRWHYKKSQRTKDLEEQNAYLAKKGAKKNRRQKIRSPKKWQLDEAIALSKPAPRAQVIATSPDKISLPRRSWRKTYIYALRDPDTHDVVYVGKSNWPELRYRQHIHGGSRRVRAWVEVLKSDGKEPELFLLEECGNGQWPQRERHWIAFFRQSLYLLNVTDGGDTYA